MHGTLLQIATDECGWTSHCWFFHNIPCNYFPREYCFKHALKTDCDPTSIPLLDTLDWNTLHPLSMRPYRTHGPFGPSLAGYPSSMRWSPPNSILIHLIWFSGWLGPICLGIRKHFSSENISKSMTTIWILFWNFVVGHPMGRGFDKKFLSSHQPSFELNNQWSQLYFVTISGWFLSEVPWNDTFNELYMVDSWQHVFHWSLEESC